MVLFRLFEKGPVTGPPGRGTDLPGAWKPRGNCPPSFIPPETPAGGPGCPLEAGARVRGA